MRHQMNVRPCVSIICAHIRLSFPRTPCVPWTLRTSIPEITHENTLFRDQKSSGIRYRPSTLQKTLEDVKSTIEQTRDGGFSENMTRSRSVRGKICVALTRTGTIQTATLERNKNLKNPPLHRLIGHSYHQCRPNHGH